MINIIARYLSDDERQQLEAAGVAILQALTALRSLTLPFEFGIAFKGEGTFNSTAGTTITLPLTLNNPDAYSVYITPKSESGFIGEISVEKSENAFTVYNSGSDITTKFEYVIIYTEYLQGGTKQ